MQQDKRTFGTVLVEGILGLVARLPLRFHLRCGRFFSWLLRDVFHYRRDVVMINLARSFPELKYKELKELYRKCYDHLGDIVAEAVWFGGCKGESGRKRLQASYLADVENPEVFNELFKGGRSMMVLASHAGNWELLGGWFCYNHREDAPYAAGYKDIRVVYRRLKSRTWDRVIGDNRCNCLIGTDFHGYLEATEILRAAISSRHEQLVYVFPTDQYPYGIATKHNVGKFMNQDTLAMTGGAAIASKFGMSVSYLRWKVVERGKYSIEFVILCEDASAFTPEQIMEKYYAELEKDIREQPWNYLWTHKRWK
jgi:KDO2-lipid IV(A) lauroyltransferase